MKAFGFLLLSLILINVCDSKYIYIKDKESDTGGTIRKTDYCSEGVDESSSFKYECDMNEAYVHYYNTSNCKGGSDKYKLCDISEICQCLNKPVDGYYIINVYSEKKRKCSLEAEISIVVQEGDCTRFDTDGYGIFELESEKEGTFYFYTDPDCEDELFNVKSEFNKCKLRGDDEAWYFSKTYPTFKDGPKTPNEETSSSISQMNISYLLYFAITLYMLL